MVFLLIFPILFGAVNADTLNKFNEEMNAGAEWHYVGEQPLSEPPVPSLPLQVFDVDTGEKVGEPYVLWKLKKD